MSNYSISGGGNFSPSSFQIPDYSKMFNNDIDAMMKSYFTPKIDDLWSKYGFTNPIYTLSTTTIADEPKQPIITNDGLNTAFNGISNLGIMMGNDKIAGIGTMGSQLFSGLSKMKGLKGINKTAGAMGIAGNMADVGKNLLFGDVHQNDSALTSSINLGMDAISSSLMAFAPVGTIAGGAMKLGSFMNDGMSALGLGTDLMTKTDLILAAIPGLGALNIGKKTLNFSANKDTFNKVGGSYMGSVQNINDAASKAGKAYGIFSNGSRRAANRFIDRMRIQQNTMTNIANEAEDLQLLGNLVDINNMNYYNNLNGGFDPRYSIAAKNGAKLTGHIDLDNKEIDWEPNITLEEINTYKEGGELIPEWEPVITEYPQTAESFKEGGILEEEWSPIITLKVGGKINLEHSSLKNVIPEGNLHARLHHMENDKNITKKGIPVIDEKGEQQAEIELNEIIFNLEVTLKLEKLYQDGSDKAAIEAGKLLVEEILFNTDDRTGLIDTLKEGGKINGSEHSFNDF